MCIDRIAGSPLARNRMAIPCICANALLQSAFPISMHVGKENLMTDTSKGLLRNKKLW